MSSSLPPKENALYKRVVKCYEHKQYKNGLKFAKQILTNPKFSEHGETMAMKGLILNGLGKKDDAYEHVRRGLKNDLKSSVCWHVYGLLQRSDKKYDEAIKCYRNALKIDKENIQILKDLSCLQIQMRDLEGFRDSTYQIVQLRPSQRTSWVGYAVACHLLKDYDMALKALDSFGKAVNDEFELSEILLYQTMLLQESGDLNGAVDNLIQNQNKICDKRSMEESLSQLYLELKKHRKADEKVCKLLKRNPDNVNYYELLSKARNCTNDDEQVALIEEYIKKFPKSSTPKRLLLNYTHGDKFRTSLDSYLRAGLIKGVPSLFIDVRSLYDDPKKAAVLEELILTYKENLEKQGTFHESDTEKEPVTALLWTYYFLALHYDHKRITSKALLFINIAIDHTPTLIELYVTKAKIYKHAGDVYKAGRWMDEAQSFDTADRYINSKCAKYFIRANMIEQAVYICSNFTTDGEDVFTYLNDIECMSFQLECAFAYQRMENWGESLKKCHEIDRHFTQIVDDQFDFHSYCLKKMTLRSYVNLLRLEDVIRSHKFYQKAAHCAINIYLKLYDQPVEQEITSVDNRDLDLDPAELKKLKNKQRKAQKKAENQKAQETSSEKREPHKPRQPTDVDVLRKVELIPDQLAKDQKPLEQALKFLKPLQQLAAGSIETHLLSYEVYRRMKKCLLMLRSVKRALKTDKNHPLVHYTLIHFGRQVEIWKSEKSLCPTKLAVIDRVIQPMFNGKSLMELNKEFLDKHKDDLSYILQGARIMYLLDNSKQKEALKLVTNLDENLKSRSIATCSEVLNSLRRGDFGSCDESIEEYRVACSLHFMFATIFLNHNEKELQSQMKLMSITCESDGSKTSPVTTDVVDGVSDIDEDHWPNIQSPVVKQTTKNNRPSPKKPNEKVSSKKHR